MTEFKSGVDLSLMEGVLRQYQEDATSLIMILQQASRFMAICLRRSSTMWPSARATARPK